MTALEMHDLVVRRGGRAVLEDVCMTVARGEVVALLGPNGAGKTTLVETALGYRSPHSGQVRILGANPFGSGPELRSRVGAMLQEGGLYPALKPIDSLRLFASFYSSPRDPVELLNLVGLAEVGQKRTYRHLSIGERQRASLAAALIGNPEFLFLDEPSTGLDVESRMRAWQLIREEQAKGVSILLTTHSLEEAEDLADRVAVLSAGRLLAFDTARGLVTRHSERQAFKTIRVNAIQPLSPACFPAFRTASNLRFNGSASILVDTPSPGETLVELAAWARDQGLQISELSVISYTLEDAFLGLLASQEVKWPLR